MGYMSGSRIARCFRESRLTSIGDGADEVMLGHMDYRDRPGNDGSEGGYSAGKPIITTFPHPEERAARLEGLVEFVWESYT